MGDYPMKFFSKLSPLLVLIFSLSVFAQQHGKPVYQNKDNVALNGYDAVAYFTEYKAERGSAKFEVIHDGTKYWFRNEKDKSLFTADPQKYLPQYGGYCAFAVGMKNALVGSNPETFKIVDGKLFLFFNDYYQGQPFNTIIPWNNNEKELHMKADKNWQALSK